MSQELSPENPAPISTPTTPSPECGPVELCIPQDVSWFMPNKEGWLCDYAYVRKEDGSMVMKLSPRGTSLGKIMVYSAPEIFRGVASLFKYPLRKGNFFYSALRNTQGRETLFADSKWVVLAMDHWGKLDRMFALVAKFGDSTAFVGAPSSFELGQEIQLRDVELHTLTIGKLRFPGIQSTDVVLKAYS